MALFIRRNGALFGGILLTAIVFLLARPVLEDHRGAFIPAALQANSGIVAMFVMTICLAVATAIGIVVTRLTNACVALFVMGAGIYALDYRLAESTEILLSGSFTPLIIEMLLWFALVLAAVVALFKFGGPLPDVHPDEDGETPSPLVSPEAFKAAAAGLLILPAVWLLSKSELTGQAVGAVFIGAMLAGLLGRLISPHVQPILLFASPLLFATIGVVIAVVVVDGTPAELFTSRKLPAPLWIAPIDYLAGSLAGMSIGYGWARSFLHHEDEEDEPVVARPTASADQ